MKTKFFYGLLIAVIIMVGFEIESGRFRIGSTVIKDSTSTYTTLNKGLYVGGGDAYVRDSINSVQFNGDYVNLNALNSAINFRGYGSQIIQGTNTLSFLQRSLIFKTRYGVEIARVDTTSGLTLNSVTKIWTGAGTPEAVVTAPVGSMWLRTDGSTSTTLYIKTSGSGNVGWTPK